MATVKKKPPQRRRTSATPNGNGSHLDADLLDLLPSQGQWSDDAYLWLTESTNKLVEFTDGRLEVLPMPTPKHQLISKFLLYLFEEYLRPNGQAYYAPLRVRIRKGKFREPDLIIFRRRDDPRIEKRYLLGADLVVEIVSADDPDRDLVEKRKDYAEGKIPEYWIVNPLDETISVLTLGKKNYRRHGVFQRGQSATSVLLPGFTVNVDSVLNAG